MVIDTPDRGAWHALLEFEYRLWQPAVVRQNWSLVPQ